MIAGQMRPDPRCRTSLTLTVAGIQKAVASLDRGEGGFA